MKNGKRFGAILTSMLLVLQVVSCGKEGSPADSGGTQADHTVSVSDETGQGNASESEEQLKPQVMWLTGSVLCGSFFRTNDA